METAIIDEFRQRMADLAERERLRSERLARMVVLNDFSEEPKHPRRHWLSFDEMMGGLFLRGLE